MLDAQNAYRIASEVKNRFDIVGYVLSAFVEPEIVKAASAGRVSCVIQLPVHDCELCRRAMSALRSLGYDTMEVDLSEGRFFIHW